MLSVQESHVGVDTRKGLNVGSKAFVLEDSYEVEEPADSMRELRKWIQKRSIKVNCDGRTLQ